MEDESTRRIDIIIVINRYKSEAEILDPTIRFERLSSQPREVDLEKKRIYEPTRYIFVNSSSQCSPTTTITTPLESLGPIPQRRERERVYIMQFSCGFVQVDSREPVDIE
ncbi:hypothetical protein C0J52_23067 [Blattella germanica]|nr:hypothetical protein C0J52_23067 [Blattella germanica]